MKALASIAATIVIVAFARASAAQTVSGSVRDAVSLAPVAGAVVTTLGPNREVLGRTLSSSSGSFQLLHANASTVRVVRIGFQPFEQPIAGATSFIDILLTPLGRALRTISVTTQPVCPSRSDQREALALWSAATDALLAMFVASRQAVDSGTVLQLLYNRVFPHEGRRLISQSTRRVVTGNAEPIRADRPPHEFVTAGYVVNRGEVSTYYGPDPEVLLDSTFAATHCLSLRERSGEVGVAFVPTQDRDSIPDIAGVLWMMRVPLALRSLTFEYRGLDRHVLFARPGGQLDFETMSNGLPVIRQWLIRTPKLIYLRSSQVLQGQTVYSQMPSVAQIHETGGMIASGRLADGTVLTSVLASLGGRVLNGRTGEGVRGATVTLDSTDQHATTDAQGQFSFETLLPGPYTVRVRDSIHVFGVRVDSARNVVPDSSITQQLVTRTATLSVEARLGEVTPRNLHLEWRAPMSGCGPDLNAERRYVVIGTVVTPDSQVVPNARVRMTWADSSRSATVETSVDASTDAKGRFVACGIPGDLRLATRVIVSTGLQHVGSTTIRRAENYKYSDRPLAPVTLVIPPGH